MASNTIMTAKSTFGDGLLMDFAPDNTQATCLTHALNATLLTMNGNELSLQNDMGNGRVETAYLPEGYVPVGTCEFGDIIYIVSYNPITNKSQIGCFPSPERNISSKELSGTKTEFDLDNFVESSGFGFNQTKNNSIKQIIYENNLNPGDKFIVHSGDIASKSNIISDYGNTSHKVDAFPKQYKINVVAIEDSGKINYLNSNLKWYTNYTNQGNQEEAKKDGDFYINSESEKDQGKPDIDSYRNILSSGYSVFQSKVSGKLAILIELERIESFNSTYEIYTKQEKSNQKLVQADTIITNIVTKPSKTEDFDPDKIEYKDYSIYINFNWETNNPNINPSQLVAYDFNWISNSIEIADVNNAAGSFICGTTIKKLDLIKEFPRNIVTAGENTATEEKNSTDGYIHRTISNYDGFTTKTYKDFIESNYDASIAKETYANATKINQSYDDFGKPIEGQYYLNLHHIVVKEGKNTYYNDKGDIIEPKNVPDCIVNNYFKSSISKHMFDISIPDKFNGEAVDCRNLILSYKVAPMMEYGILTDLVQTHYIDFSKIGSGEISLNGYKYYNGENLCTLQIYSSIYPEENKGVAGIELQFYDNQGQCAVYNINNRASYSGIITSYIPLNGNQTTHNLSSYQNEKLIVHAGQVFIKNAANYTVDNYDSSLSYVYLIEDEDGKLAPKEVVYKNINQIDRWYYKEDLEKAKSDPKFKLNSIDFTNTKYKSIYYNDAGTLYSNMLYAVKIVYKYTTKNALGEYDTTNKSNEKCEWRWLWTNTMFNQYYYNVSDFKDNKFELQLDLSADYSTTAKLSPDTKSENSIYDSENEYKNLGVITQSYDGDIKSEINIGLTNTYNTFSLYGDIKDKTTYEGLYKYFSMNVYIPNTFNVSYNIQNSEEIEQKYKDYLQPIKSDDNNINSSLNTESNSIYSGSNSYKNYKDVLNLQFKESSTKDKISYIDSNQNLKENQSCTKLGYNWVNILNSDNKPIVFQLMLRNYNKYMQKYETVSNSVSIEPLIRDYSFLESLGIKYKNNTLKGDTKNYGHFYFENVYSIFPWADNSKGSPDKHNCILKFIVDEDYNMDLRQLKDLSSMRYILGNTERTNQISGYWFKGGSGTASRSQLMTSNRGHFSQGPTGTDGAYTKATININKGFFLNLILPFDYNQTANASNMEAGSVNWNPKGKWNFKPYYPTTNNKYILAQIGFKGDDKGAWHLFNDYCVINTQPQNKDYRRGYNKNVQQTYIGNNPIMQQGESSQMQYTIADMLVFVLNNMYVQRYCNDSKILHTSNIQYEYESIYTQDIIYTLDKEKNIDNFNDVLLMHGQYYSDYIEQITSQIGKDICKIDKSCNLQLDNIIKNLPISINIKSKKDQPITNNIANNTGKIIKNINASSGLLQISDDSLIPINSTFRYESGLRSVILSDNTLQLKFEGKIRSNDISKYAYSVFDYKNDTLTLKRDTPVGAPENYSWCNKSDRGWSAIYDLFKSECLINRWQLV